jgi:hypothetical protein
MFTERKKMIKREPFMQITLMLMPSNMLGTDRAITMSTVRGEGGRGWIKTPLLSLLIDSP